MFSVLSADINIYRILDPDKNTLDTIYGHFDVLGFRPAEYIDFLSTEEMLSILDGKNISFQLHKTSHELKTEIARSIPGYNSYNQKVKMLFHLANQYPHIVRVHELGLARGLWYFILGNNNYIDFRHRIFALQITNFSNLHKKPVLIFNGVHHAREPIGSEICLYAAYELAENYDLDPEISNIVDNTEIWLIPQVNPDGYKIVIDNYVGTYSALWRKNIRDNNNSGDVSPPYYFGYFYPDGVDLNRNYGISWSSSAGTPASQTYPGPYPFSEPESQALKVLYDWLKPVFSICYHTYSELILYPLGYSNNLTVPDVETLHNIGLDMNSIIFEDIGRDYIVQNSADLYPASGTSTDYFYGQNRTFAYIFEIGTQFITPQDEILPISQTMFNVIKYLAQRSLRSIATGIVKDSSNNSPVIATIIIPEIDYSGTPNLEMLDQKTRADGVFHRPLEPGNYTLVVEADGYETFETSFTIVDNEKTSLNIYLDPLQSKVPAINFEGPCAGTSILLK